MKRNHLKLISPDEATQVRDAAVKILLKYGYFIQNENTLRRLEKKGFKVDYPGFHVTLTEEAIEKLEKCARETNRNQATEEYVRRASSDGYTFGRNIVKTVDVHTGERRQAVHQDNIDFLKAAQNIADIKRVAPIYTSCDLPNEVEVVHAVADSILYSSKPMGGFEIMEACQIPYIEELLTIKNNRQVKITDSFASMTRFTLDERAAACLDYIGQTNGLTDWGTNSCIFPGINGPLSLLGSCAMAMAEMVGGWICGYAYNDQIRLNCIPVSGTMDMRSTRMLYSSPAAVLQDAMLYQIFQYQYGMSTVPECTATYVDAKYPGIRALHDKVFKTMSLFSYTGCQVGVHFGMLEGGTAIAPAQIMLDLELNRKLEKLTVGLDGLYGDMRLDDLLDLGPLGDYLQTDYTLDHYQEYLFSEKYSDCSSDQSFNIVDDMKYDQDKIDSAGHDFINALRKHDGMACSQETEAEVNKILKAAYDKCVRQ